MAHYGPACYVCGSRDCPGCEVAEEDVDPELESLEQTPEGRDWVPDQRDATREPPAELDPWMVLKARRWLMTDEGWKDLKTKREGMTNA